MLDEITPVQFLEWMSYEELEPWDERRGDFRAASIVATLANVNRDPNKQPRAFSPSDFLIYRSADFQREFDPTESVKAKQTPEDQAEIMRQWVSAYTGKYITHDWKIEG